MRAAGPKVFAGFSDITVLHQAFATRLGLATLYGPAAAGVDFVKNARAQEHLRATLFDPESVRTVTAVPPGGTVLVPGRARGVTLGGCLSLLASDLGTPHALAGARGGLLLIEDVGESPYRIDRYLTQLLRTGWLDGVAGIVLGSWAGCGPYQELRAVFADRLGGLGVPVVEEFGFGHCEGALTMPLGATAELDAATGTLTFDAPALS
jgi:muramoyltetrapeptide carboxypeptidase